MEEITIGQAQKLTAPNPFALLSVQIPNGKTNVMAISWWTYASNRPATVIVCLSKKGYSGSCIQQSGSFGLSVVGKQCCESAFKAGTCSGRNMDKVEALQLPMIRPAKFEQDVVDGSRVCFSCKLTNSMEVGDHVLYVGEVTTILGDASVAGLYAFDGYARLDTL